ncbi:S9 family peptidase [Pontibacter sp. G13]|uniref:S9 family peptidase n=1 Tax=Pontibacter sp. G13 TaxID=3074898 RepID=UPI00288919FD|nr:S9 family peptidase [Pontibacter sp. G13]WNJ19698.1 S9 family peptidase [Pontibacter sp. G13]
MKKFTLPLICATLLGCTAQESAPPTFDPGTPPLATQKDTTLIEHDNQRVDPYFWMRLSDEQKNAETPDAQTQQVVEYLEAENAYTDRQLASTEALQETLFEEITGRLKQDDESVPRFENGYWYYSRYETGKEYPIFCRKKGTLDATEEILLDANQQAEGLDYYAVSGLKVSPDNQMLAFAEDKLSRRIYTVRFKNLETGEILPDALPNATPGGAWASDNATFFYTTKNKTTLLPEKVWRHRLGSDAGADEMVYEETDPTFYTGVFASKSRAYIIISNSSTLVSDYQILKADDPTGDFQAFSPRETRHEYQIEHIDDKFYIVTNWDAENFRIMETPETATEKSNWKEFMPHHADTLIAGLEVFNGHLVISQRANALTHIKVINRENGQSHHLSFDEPAYVVRPTGNSEIDTDWLRISYSSLATPNSIYDYQMDTREMDLKKRTEVVGGHNPADYTVERIFAEARDGVKVPISLIYRKDVKLDGTAPLLLYSYGSYGSSTNPYFSSTRLSLLDRGFIYAIAHIRGGQEMGRQWYEDGKMFKKKNTFYDFIDCGQFLAEQNYSSPAHMYAMGGSAGGLLMGAVVNMAPEAFHGVVAAVPFVDVISTMWDESIPLTTQEFDEWGNPKNKDSYDYMLSYSPYDQVKAQNYPHMMVTAGYFDSQVQYWEPAKWVAKLRSVKTDDNLLLLETNMSAGHGGASGRFARYHLIAKEYAFFLMLEGLDS